MLQALGEPLQAEAMARRSLQSWAGVAHTETLSLLVLGSVLSFLGRHAEAEAAVQQGLRLARLLLRVSNWVLTAVLCASAQGVAPEENELQRLREASARLQHPLVQAREARVDAELALLAGDAPASRLPPSSRPAASRGRTERSPLIRR